MSDGSNSRWGRIAEDGTVFVRTDAGERSVGSWRAGSPEEGLAHFERRYLELDTEVALLERRLAAATTDVAGVHATATRLRDSLATASVVGDISALERRLAALLALAQERREQRAAARAQQASAAADGKRVLAEEAEGLAASSEWKATGDRFRVLVEDYRAITGVERRTDNELWKRIMAAREEFTRRRSAHFAALDEQRSAARTRKEELVAEAEQLSGSTDWAPTATRYKALMSRWKAAGRAQRDVDDALWARFRAAQDEFFARRNAQHAERDAEYSINQEQKEALLTAEAPAVEAALESGDVDRAERLLRDLQRRWEAIGRVPREAASALERRMGSLEERVREAASARWRQPDVESSTLVVRLRESVAKLERRAERARAAGKAAEAAEAEAALATQREWLAQALR